MAAIAKQKTRGKKNRRENEGYAFILPGIIYMILVVGYPIVYNFILSFKDTNVQNLAKGTSVFIGLQNYKELFSNPTFLLILKNTFIFTFGSLVFQFTIGYLLALFFYKRFTLAGPIRGLMLIPYMMPMAVTGPVSSEWPDQRDSFLVRRGCASVADVHCHRHGRRSHHELLGRHSFQHASSDLGTLQCA